MILSPDVTPAAKEPELCRSMTSAVPAVKKIKATVAIIFHPKLLFSGSSDVYCA
jgi:hypothetical protein